ncbi:MAG: sulfurtransferase [Deltaproteobacteria bacterium]|nr:sulfurtransferase [Deltaproteobacteria bacterium]
MKKRFLCIAFLCTLIPAMVVAGSAFASEKGAVKTSGGWAYSVAVGHPGGDVTPSEAMKMVMDDTAHTFIVDVRTRPEYTFVGHPAAAYHVPSKFWTGKMIEKEGKPDFELVDNPHFAKDLLARFNPETDTLIFMCRSGKRSCQGAEKAIKAGFKPDKVFNMLGGFEGDKVKCKVSAFNGLRMLGGWKNEGLPWTYHLDKKLCYDSFQAAK